MVILQSCCCWETVRDGSIATAIYTAIYYLLTMFIMGVTIFYDLEYYVSQGKEQQRAARNASLEPGGATAVTPSAAAVPLPKNVSFLEPTHISKTTMIYYLVVLSCSFTGLVSSFLLYFGIKLDKKCMLIPWMCNMIVSNLVDLSHSVYWLTLDDPSFSPLTAVLFTVELFIFVLNVYAWLCVYSQYKEYKRGQGTAAFYATTKRELEMKRVEYMCAGDEGGAYMVSTSNNFVGGVMRGAARAAAAAAATTTTVVSTGGAESYLLTAAADSRSSICCAHLLLPSQQTQMDVSTVSSDYLWCAETELLAEQNDDREEQEEECCTKLKKEKALVRRWSMAAMKKSKRRKSVKNEKHEERNDEDVSSSVEKEKTDEMEKAEEKHFPEEKKEEEEEAIPEETST